MSSKEDITSSIASLRGDGVFPFTSDGAAGDGSLDIGAKRSSRSNGAGDTSLGG